MAASRVPCLPMGVSRIRFLAQNDFDWFPIRFCVFTKGMRNGKSRSRPTNLVDEAGIVGQIVDLFEAGYRDNWLRRDSARELFDLGQFLHQ